ncbi:hypothetical protein [Streptomyces sp. NPDC050600]|uniref:hypothetical protein n=1 Tax=Streptomyces sp. NPDC050600 TaxID=3157213 RepID=UPI00342BF3A1
MAHRLQFDPATPEGEAIVVLFNLIKADEDPGGSWNGGDVVDTLGYWFGDLGVDIDAGPISTMSRDEAPGAAAGLAPPGRALRRARSRVVRRRGA